MATIGKKRDRRTLGVNRRGRQVEPWWGIPLVVLLLPLIGLMLVLWVLYSASLYLLVWGCWLPRGRDVLFVYSDSPHWKEFAEQEVLPRIRHRAVFLNWSERKTWIRGMGLAPRVFRHFGGSRNFNPIAFHFRPLRLHRTFRFRDACRKWRRTGDRTELDDILARFYAKLGA
jgi:hypothetical protein